VTLPPDETPPSPDDRRSTTRDTPDRRRASWHGFREAYPTFLKITAAIFLLLVAGDMWLGYQRVTYGREIARLRAGMTAAERSRTDAIVQNEHDKLRMAYALARHQAQVDPRLNLAIAVDSGRMYLQRNGALLRVMVVSVTPAPIPGAAPGDTSARALPRGVRTVASVDSGATPVIVLDGGARIYGGTDGGIATPGNVRARLSDLRAILPNVSAGMSVYFY